MSAGPDRAEGVSRDVASDDGADRGDPGTSGGLGFVVSEDRVPTVVAKIAAGAPIRWVWHNALGGKTFRIDHESGTEFIKWAPDHPETNLQLEAKKLEWASHYIRVPEVLGVGRDSDTSAWLRTRAIPAASKVAPKWKSQPRLAARAIGAGCDRCTIGST